MLANAKHNNVPYNAERAKEVEAKWGSVDFDSPVDLFVNCNYVNYEDTKQEVFESKGQYIAWYDEENEWGFVNK